MTEEASPAPAPDPAAGGSYTRDPATGALTLVERSAVAEPQPNPQPE